MTIFDNVYSIDLSGQTIEVLGSSLPVGENEFSFWNNVRDENRDHVDDITLHDSGEYNSPTIKWTDLTEDDTSRSYDFTHTIHLFNDELVEFSGTVTVPIRWYEDPVIHAEDKTLTVGDTFDPLEGVTATDPQEGDITDRINVDQGDVDAVNTNTPGQYDVTYSVWGYLENIVYKTITVTVVEANEPPVIEAEDKTIQVGDDYDPLEDVTATDPEDGDITGDIQVVKNEVDTAKPGEYEVTYEVEDSDGEKATKTITVTVVAINEPPVIEAEDKTIQVGDDYDPLEDVTATDPEDGDVTGDIQVVKNEVDTAKPGEYEVTYEVEDSDGEKATKTITVTVEDVEDVKDAEDQLPQTGEAKLYLFIFAGILLVGAGIFVIRRQFTKKA